MASPKLRVNFETKLANLLKIKKGGDAPEEWELKLLDITGKYLARTEDDSSYGGGLTGLNEVKGAEEDGSED